MEISKYISLDPLFFFINVTSAINLNFDRLKGFSLINVEIVPRIYMKIFDTKEIKLILKRIIKIV